MWAMFGLRSALSTFPLISNLRRMPPQSPDEIVSFVLSQRTIRPMEVESELRQFAELVADLRPRTILEIGTFNGGTL
jgi:hypothetical protein